MVGDMVREPGAGSQGQKDSPALRSVNASPCEAGSERTRPTLGRLGLWRAPLDPPKVKGQRLRGRQNVYLSPSCIVRGRSALIACRKNGDRRSPTTLPKFTRS